MGLMSFRLGFLKRKTKRRAQFGSTTHVNSLVMPFDNMFDN